MNNDFDILIVGGGLVGASLACALEHTGARIGLLEARSLEVVDTNKDIDDDRAIALAEGSRRIFEGLGMWRHLQGQVAPIRHIHVSDRGGFGFSHMDAENEGLRALGYVAEARSLARAMSAAMAELRNVELIAPARLTGLKMCTDHVDVSYEGEQEGRLRTRLLVAADGVQSSVRRMLGVSIHDKDYGQTAVVANVIPGKPHQAWAYERFTDSGPLALLPLSPGAVSKDRCAVVWTVENADAPELLAASDEAFLAGLQQRFGWRLGRFKGAGPRQAYPLHLIHSTETVRPRLAIVGNAAHTLHPIGGQGFNLGLRDVAMLAEVLGPALNDGADPGDLSILESYRQARERDMDAVSQFTDGLARLFSNANPALRLGRNLGLLALDRIPSAKRILARHAAGVAGAVPDLALGWTQKGL